MVVSVGCAARAPDDAGVGDAGARADSVVADAFVVTDARGDLYVRCIAYCADTMCCAREIGACDCPTLCDSVAMQIDCCGIELRAAFDCASASADACNACAMELQRAGECAFAPDAGVPPSCPDAPDSG